jgi:hypothetical protein
LSFLNSELPACLIAGRLNTELLRVFGVESLPAADDPPDRLFREEPIQYIETDVLPSHTHEDEATIDVSPQRHASAALGGLELPPHIEVTQLYASISGRRRSLAVVVTAIPLLPG